MNTKTEEIIIQLVDDLLKKKYSQDNLLFWVFLIVTFHYLMFLPYFIIDVKTKISEWRSKKLNKIDELNQKYE